MTEEEATNLAIMKQAYVTNDFFATADDNTELHEAMSLPYGGVYRGKAALKDLVTCMRAAWKRPGADCKSAPTDHHEAEFAVAGDTVYVYLSFSGKSLKTGNPFTFPVVEAFRFKNGVLVDIKPFYFDVQLALDT